MICPCGTEKEYADCCEPYLSGKRHAPTPEMLMRSRYSAYVKGAVSYLKATLAPESQSDFSEKDALEWSKNSEWLGLQITSAKDDTVEFIVKYKTQGKVYDHHEVSKFKHHGNRWYFLDGESHLHEEGKGCGAHLTPQAPIVRGAPKIGRNDPCACGSGKKSKKCCAA